MPSARDALALAARNIAVIPVYKPTGIEQCSCNNPNCDSIGKHPRVMRGVHSATVDTLLITKWFEEDVNIGAATGSASGGLMVLDVDDINIAAALLDPELALADETVVSTTGKGCHVYFYTTGNTASLTIFDSRGERIADLRGDGTYVVAPPSLHRSGKNYKWVGSQYGDMPDDVVMVGDTLEFIRKTLGYVNVEIREPRYVSVEIPDNLNVLPMDVPFELEDNEKDQMLRQLLTGTYPSEDRSATLARLGFEIVESANRHRYPISAEEVAGIIRKVDAVSYRKYTDRNDGGKEYFKLGKDSLEKVGESTGDDDPNENPVATRPSRYRFGRITGLVYVPGGKRQDVEVANFKPIIIETVTVEHGDDENHAEEDRTYVVELERVDGKKVTFSVDSDIMSSGTKTRRIIAKHAPGFRIEASGTDHIWPAAMSLSDPTDRTEYGHVGWTRDGSMFLMPKVGGITANGIAEGVSIDIHEGSQFSLYGLGCQLPAPDDGPAMADAFSNLLKSSKAHIVVPVIVQVLAGPLANLGLENAPPFVHIYGITGSYKTSLAAAALSMFGTFESGRVPTPWNSTPNALGRLMHLSKDLTMLVDDYKRSIPGDFTTFIQNYADRTSRARMTRTLKLEDGIHSRGILLSTGEDSWESQESVQARVIAIESNKPDVDLAHLSEARSAVTRGVMQRIGMAYLQWCVRRGMAALRDDITAGREVAMKFLTADNRDWPHARVLASTASLLAAGTVVTAFLKDVLPAVADDWRYAQREAWMHLRDSAMESSLDAVEDNPIRKTLAILRAAIYQGLGYVQGIELVREKETIHTVRKLDENTIGQRIMATGPADGLMLGLNSGRWLYLNEDVTYQSIQRQIFRERLPYSWRAVTNAAAQSGGVKGVKLYGDYSGGRWCRVSTEMLTNIQEDSSLMETIRDLLND